MCEICGTEHAGPCTLGQKQNPQIQAMLTTKQPREWLNNNSLERSNVKTRGATPYCMHCGYKDNLHDPNCPLVREKAMYFQCSFCGDVGHPSDNCAARLQVLQEQQRGYLCSYCGAVDHTSENCSKLRENIAREKADINRRNIEKYEASKQNTAKGQEDTYRTQQGRTDNGEQSKQVPKQMTSSGGPHPHPGGTGGTGGGEQPPQKPNGDKNLPPDKIDQEEEEQEEEDSDRTITVLESTSGEGVRIVKGDETELSLKQLLKLVGRSKRRRKRRAHRKGKGGGDSPSSSGGSEEDSNESDLEIRGIRGKRGHRGQRGRTGPQGPVGPPIHIPMPPPQPVPMTVPSKDANITINNDGMEWSFRTLSNSLTQMFAQQASLNQTLHSHLTQGIQAQGDQVLALQQLAFSSHQREYDHLFNAIPIYDGEDPSKCEGWIEKLETACRTGKRDIRDVAITCAEGPVLEVINSVKADEEWPVLRDEVRRCFLENKTPVHAAALLDEFPTQTANQNLRSFLYKYIKLHKMATGIQARDDFDLRQKLHFLK